MEVKEIWSEFKDRITSPFFASYAISWLVCNWKIPVVLFFYKIDDLEKGKTTYIDFIQRHSNPLLTIIIPLSTAFVYTFGYPHFKRLIKVYLAGEDLKTETKLLKLSETRNVPLEKFIATKAALKERELNLIKLYEDEGVINEKNKTLEATNIGLSIKIKELETDKINLSNDHHEAIAETNRVHAEILQNINLDHDKTIKEYNLVANNRIKAIRDENSITSSELQNQVTQKTQIVFAQATEIEQLKTEKEHYRTHLNELEVAFNGMQLELRKTIQSKNEMAEVVRLKDQEIENEKALTNNISNSYRALVKKDLDVFKLGYTTNIQLLKAVNDVLDDVNKIKIDDSIRNFRNRISDLQREVNSDPMV